MVFDLVRQIKVATILTLDLSLIIRKHPWTMSICRQVVQSVGAAITQLDLLLAYVFLAVWRLICYVRLLIFARAFRPDLIY